MCHYSDPSYRERNKGYFTDSQIERIAAMFFPLTVQCVIGCAAEPALHKNLSWIVALAKRHKVPFVGIATNGQLLNESLAQKLTAEGLDEIVISLHGVHKETYERFMVNASYDRLHQTLQMLTLLPREKTHSRPHVRINYTVNHENLAELADFFAVFGSYAIATLQIRIMFDLGNTGYACRDMHDVKTQYEDVIKKLTVQCRDRRITLLASRTIPSAGALGGLAAILPLVLRHIRPQKVWRTDFEWERETYGEFCKRIGWRRELFGAVIKGLKCFDEAHRHLMYDANL